MTPTSPIIPSPTSTNTAGDKARVDRLAQLMLRLQTHTLGPDVLAALLDALESAGATGYGQAIVTFRNGRCIVQSTSSTRIK